MPVSETSYPPIPRDTLLAFLKEHGFSLNAMARRIGFSPSHVSKVVRGEDPSQMVWAAVHKFMGNPDGYRRPMSRKERAAVHAARRLLMSKGFLRKPA